MKLFFIASGAVVLLAIAGIFILPAPKAIDPNDPNVVATNGLHWHPQLQIFVKGERVEIPQNIGIGAVHQPIHTHDDLPIIHLEFQGVVRKQDITLGRFFDIWGKDMRSFGSNMRPSDERGSTERSSANVRMMVNGEENTEYENYIMGDGDKIELRYD